MALIHTLKSFVDKPLFLDVDITHRYDISLSQINDDFSRTVIENNCNILLAVSCEILSVTSTLPNNIQNR